MNRNELPRVSVIVPVLNGERTLRPCLVSLLATEYPSDRREIIVVDNGSTDRTAEIIRSVPVRYVHEARRGASCARNRGIAESTGEILAFTDADCVASNGWLRELVGAFSTPVVGGAAGEILAFPPKTPAERYMAMSHGNWQQRALRGGWPFAATANVAYRRSTLDRIGSFDPRLVSGEDKDLGWRFFRHGGMELRYCPRAIVFHRHHTTAAAFVRQHIGWSYGNALLHAKYGLSWGMRDEVPKYGELLESVGDLVRASARYSLRGGEKMDVYYPYFEVLRRLTYRLGALRWVLTRRSLRARFAATEGERAP